MNKYKDHCYVKPIITFLDKIGLKTNLKPLSFESQLPGVLIHKGTLEIDLNQLLYPGDILHEAGKIAIAPKEVRPTLSEPIGSSMDLDAATISMMTMAWSYAAALSADIPADIVFHPEGYNGQSHSILSGYESGNYMGLPMLQWLHMAFDANNAHVKGQMAFPAMHNWLRP